MREMNRKIIVSAGAVLISIGIAALSTAWAQTATPPAGKKFPTPTVAIVDINQIMQTSEAAKSLRSQLDKARAGFQQTLQSKNDEFRKMEDDLQRQREVLSPEAFQQKQKEFQQKVADAQRETQDRRNKSEEALGKAQLQVETALNQIVDQIAKEQGITLVLTRQAALHFEPEMDITGEVVKRLNAKLPSVTLAFPK
jgi:outer membrane protein